MQTARRLYVYLLSGISLGVLVTGVSMLLTVLLQSVGLSFGGPPLGGGDVTGQQLTLALALTVVSLPVWLIHWLVAERSVRAGRPDADVERSSSVRGLYFAIAMGLLLIAVGMAVSSVIQEAVARLGDAQFFGGSGVAGGLALAAAAGCAWLYHAWLRNRDWARGPMTDGGAWLPRTYLYLAAFVGLMLLLSGLGGLLELIGRLILEPPPLIDAPDVWWTYPLGTSLAGLLVGGATWIGHLLYSNGLVREGGWRGASERPAKLRLAYFVAVVMATAAGAILLASDSVRVAIEATLGLAPSDEPAALLALVLLPLVTASAYAVAWWVHARWMEREAARSGSGERVETAARLELYPLALVGLAVGATGTAWLVGLLLESLLAGGRALSGGDFAQRDLARWTPMALIGTAVWIRAWRGVELRRAVDAAAEASSTVRRALLLIVLAGSILAGIAAAGLILYRLFGAIVGISQSGDPAAELSTPIGVLVVAVAIAAYHAVALRRDQGLTAELPGPAVATAPIALDLRLTVPAGGDPESVLATITERLPPGYALEVAKPPLEEG